MSFLDSDIVRQEIDECNYLRELSEELERVALESQDESISVEYYHTLYALMNKQEIIYTRICLLSEDETAVILKEKIIREMISNGMPPYKNVITFLEETKKEIRDQLIALTGEGFDTTIDLLENSRVPDTTINCGKSKQSY
jgi:hypothetical protein